MIKLTHLNGDAFVLNADLICYVEQRPDTFITLTSGDRVVVRESIEEVLQRALEYQRSKHLVPTPPRGTALTRQPLRSRLNEERRGYRLPE